MEILDSASKNGKFHSFKHLKIKKIYILYSFLLSDSRYGCLWIALKYFCEEQQQSNKSMSSSASAFKSPSSPLNQSLIGGGPIQLTSPSRQQSLNTSFDAGNVVTTPTMSKSGVSSSSQQPAFSESILKECNELTENFDSPYLRALFNYLINKEDALAKILVYYIILIYYLIILIYD